MKGLRMKKFQSPKSGKIELNVIRVIQGVNNIGFQSPKSGKIELNSLKFITKLTMKF